MDIFSWPQLVPILGLAIDPPMAAGHTIDRDLNQGQPLESAEVVLSSFLVSFSSSDLNAEGHFVLFGALHFFILKLVRIARLTCERGRRPWPVGTRTEGTGVAFAQAKGMTAEARQVDILIANFSFEW
jgi:hypothetical protein